MTSKDITKRGPSRANCRFCKQPNYQALEAYYEDDV